MTERWLKERNGQEPPTFCPLADDGRSVVIGMNFVGDRPPRGEPVIGEFWIDDDNVLHIELYDEAP